jgi:hypothetical protein
MARRQTRAPLPQARETIFFFLFGVLRLHELHPKAFQLPCGYYIWKCDRLRRKHTRARSLINLDY